jgi:hypothetical protein
MDAQRRSRHGGYRVGPNVKLLCRSCGANYLSSASVTTTDDVMGRANHTRPGMAPACTGGGVQVWNTEEKAKVRPREKEKGGRGPKEILEPRVVVDKQSRRWGRHDFCSSMHVHQ